MIRRTGQEKTAIFLSGPIGSGKSTLGAALAECLGAQFIEGDVYSRADVPWFASTLTTARSILGAIMASDKPISIIAYPLRCREWLFYQRHLSPRNIGTLTISLSAAYENIVRPVRGRVFSPKEHDRIRMMIAQGYHDRAFSDVVVRTDQTDRDETLAILGSIVAQQLDTGHVQTAC